jgi:hypothetical protein
VHSQKSLTGSKNNEIKFVCSKTRPRNWRIRCIRAALIIHVPPLPPFSHRYGRCVALRVAEWDCGGDEMNSPVSVSLVRRVTIATRVVPPVLFRVKQRWVYHIYHNAVEVNEVTGSNCWKHSNIDRQNHSIVAGQGRTRLPFAYPECLLEEPMW